MSVFKHFEKPFVCDGAAIWFFRHVPGSRRAVISRIRCDGPARADKTIRPDRSPRPCPSTSDRKNRPTAPTSRRPHVHPRPTRVGRAERVDAAACMVATGRPRSYAKIVRVHRTGGRKSNRTRPRARASRHESNVT